MAEFLNKDKAYSEIVDIVGKATNEVVLITPYIDVPDDLFKRLRYQDEKGVKTVIVCRGKDLTTEVKSKLKQLKRLELRFDEELHAKCFYNQDSMVITSLNLLEYSQQHNREMGILLNLAEDEVVFTEALDEAKFIIDNAKKHSGIQSLVESISSISKKAESLLDYQVDSGTQRTSVKRTERGGFCIRCDKRIVYDEKAPYCLTCFRVWNKHKNPVYEEKYCHSCGESKQRITMAKPLCITCFRKS